MKIVFTSCMDAERVPTQPIWSKIAADLPDVLMLLGDQIYMDWGDFGTSNWKTAVEKDGDRAVEEFKIDMHRRYSMQWAVPQFKDLICEFVQKKQARDLHITWDDHDFAWNNSVGVIGNPNDHGVDARIKAVSLALFQQFKSVLRAGNRTAIYPDIPEIPPVTASDVGIDEFATLPGTPEITFALLDTRWNRTHRPEATMLDQNAFTTLKQEVSKENTGLIIVAGGSPMAYKYTLANQGWLSLDPAKNSYHEYNWLLDSAKRPVLYLGGDVHKNSWGGSLETTTTGQKSSVMQILSSGAAIASIGPKRFAPSYAVLKVTETSATTGTVNATFVDQDKTGHWQSRPLPRLDYDGNKWLNQYDGDVASLIQSADKQPLSMVSFYSRSHDYRDANPSMPFHELGELDKVFDSRPATGDWPESWTVTAPTIAEEISLNYEGVLDSNKKDEELDALVKSTFDRARANHKKSVVLFIHGIGHPFGRAAEQGYSLRQAYPECEPLVFAWPSGGGGGLLGALFAVQTAISSANRCASALRKVILSYCAAGRETQNQYLTKTVVARSAGSYVLHSALQEAAGANQQQTISQGVDRVVLSPPLLLTSTFTKEDATGSFAHFTLPKFVLLNQNDQILKRAKFQNGFGDTLGKDTPPVSLTNNSIYLDFTHSPGVLSLHDYLTININSSQYEVTRQLLCEKIFTPEALTNQLRQSSVNPKVFDVK